MKKTVISVMKSLLICPTSWGHVFRLKMESDHFIIEYLNAETIHKIRCYFHETSSFGSVCRYSVESMQLQMKRPHVWIHHKPSHTNSDLFSFFQLFGSFVFTHICVFIGLHCDDVWLVCLISNLLVKWAAAPFNRWRLHPLLCCCFIISVLTFSKDL